MLVQFLIGKHIIKDSRELEDIFKIIGEGSILTMPMIKKIHFEKIFVKSIFRGALENAKDCIGKSKQNLI